MIHLDHAGGHVTTTCQHCGRPISDQAYACPRCADKARTHLATIVDMTPAARDVAQRQTSHTSGGSSGKPGSSLPLDLGATARLDATLAALSRWVDTIAVTRGTVRPWFTRHGDPLIAAAQWLTNHLEWMRHRTDAAAFLDDVAAAARVVAGLAHGPSEQKYLGPCGAENVECKVCQVRDLDHHRDCDVTCPHKFVPGTCEGDVYARIHTDGTVAHTGTCRTCRATVDTSERTAWLDSEVRNHVFRAAEIANAYGVNVKTIRSWAARGQLLEHGRDREERPLFNVGDVLDLAAADAARRETERAKRARREAQRETEDAA